MSDSSTLFDGPETRQRAIKCARGDYQRSLLRGEARWSGSDLRGKARRWGMVYRESRENLIKRMTAAGIKHRFITGPRGLRVLLVSA